MLCIDFITYKYVNKQISTVCQSAKLTSTHAVLIKAPGNISTNKKKAVKNIVQPDLYMD